MQHPDKCYLVVKLGICFEELCPQWYLRKLFIMILQLKLGIMQNKRLMIKVFEDTRKQNGRWNWKQKAWANQDSPDIKEPQKRRSLVRRCSSVGCYLDKNSLTECWYSNLILGQRYKKRESSSKKEVAATTIFWQSFISRFVCIHGYHE